jgi:hypothetical protein
MPYQMAASTKTGAPHILSNAIFFPISLPDKTPNAQIVPGQKIREKRTITGL